MVENKSVLILGGGGFLGIAVSEYLCKTGWNVHIVGRSSYDSKNDNIIFHQGCIDDKFLLRCLLPECDSVIHLASGTTPGSSAGQPVVEADLNIVPTLTFLDIFRTHGNSRMIFVSSGGTLYGNPDAVPVTEKHVFSPLSYHGAGKVAIEAFLQAFANDTGKSIAVLRPSNLYGPGQSIRKGFGLIRTILEHLYAGTEMEIWGDGENVRDFLYIQDMVNAIDSILTSSVQHMIFNVGAGRGHTLNEVIKIAEEVSGRKLNAKYMPARKVDVRKVILDCERIKKETGWQSQTSLQEGVHRTWEWLKKRKSR